MYNIEGNTVFAFGGGYFINKYRRTERISWSPQEMPSEEEYRDAIANIERVNYQFDYIIKHTSPSETIYYLSTLEANRRIIGQYNIKRKLFVKMTS